MKSALRHKIARAAAREAFEEAVKRGPARPEEGVVLKLTPPHQSHYVFTVGAGGGGGTGRVAGHQTHRGRCGKKYFPPETPRPHDPEAVGGTD